MAQIASANPSGETQSIDFFFVHSFKKNSLIIKYMPGTVHGIGGLAMNKNKKYPSFESCTFGKEGTMLKKYRSVQ